MDPLGQLNAVHSQEPLPRALDLSKRCKKTPVTRSHMEALDLVTRPGGHDRSSGTKSVSELVSKNAQSEMSFLPQEHGASPTPSLHSVSSVNVSEDSTECPSQARKSATVETFSSECTTSDLNFPSSECVSSDDSDALYVPKLSSICKRLSNGRLLTRRRKHIENQYSEYTEHDNAPENGYVSSLRNSEETVESDELSSHTALLDSDPGTDTLESKHAPSTSDAENADAFKPTRNAASSSSSSLNLLSPKNAHKRALTPKKRERTDRGQKAAARTAKGKRKKARPSAPSSVFAPQEPEIKLKYTSYKEERRESRGDSFAPYVRLESSTCTVVNFDDDTEDAIQARKSQQFAASTGVIPTTSCLQLGRLSTEGRGQTSELCCLCHQTANAAGLGDLHGPYHPCDRIPTEKSASRLDSTLKSSRLSACENSAKRKFPSQCGGGERWVHEDCSVWSTGVFLVKGKLYGLVEALRIAEKVVCSCCQRTGATLGCFFKGCPNKYHFPCALQAECVLNEENFTIRCPKHKNKVSIATLQNR